MKFFTVLPMWNYSSKRILIKNEHHMQSAFIQRKYKHIWDKFIHYLPLSFLHKINLYGENKDTIIEIKEQSFKSNLIKLKWDVWIKNIDQEDEYLLEDKTKISTNPRMIYVKNNQEYLFSKNLLSRICEVKVNDQVCAKINIEKKIPMSLQVIYKNEDVDLTVVELLGIYYIITLTY